MLDITFSILPQFEPDECILKSHKKMIITKFEEEDNFFKTALPQSEPNTYNEIKTDRINDGIKESLISRMNSDDCLKRPSLMKLQYTSNIAKQDIYNKLTSFLQNVSEKQHLNFLMSTPIKEKTISCKIIKVSESILGKLYPTYFMYMDINDKLLMSGKKIYKTTSTTYSIFLDDNKTYLGKLSSNFLVNEFNLYDSGRKHDEKSKNPLRTQYAYIQYGINILGKKGPREMKVDLPLLLDDEITSLQPSSNKEYLKNLSKEKKLCLFNKPPVWDELYKSYFLKFNGRVHKGSSKNFQLISPEDDSILLQFGIVNDYTYSVDFQFPISPYQAFGICLSSIATKVVCE